MNRKWKLDSQKGFDQILGLSASLYAPCLRWDDFAALLEKMSVSVGLFIERQCNDFDRNIKRIFFGAGSYGRYLLQHCRALGVAPDYFCDNDVASGGPWVTKISKKQHSYIDGLYVLAPNELKGIENSQVVAAAKNVPWLRPVIGRQLREMGAPVMPAPECYLYEAIMMNSYINFYMRHLDSLREVYEMLHDDRSRFVYLSVLKGHIVPIEVSDITCLSMMESGQYWPFNEFKNLADAAFVDAGAFNGDTVTNFIYNNIAAGFRDVYAFEPDEALFRKLSQNVRRLSEHFRIAPEKLHLVHGGLGCLGEAPPSISIKKISDANPLSMPLGITALLPCEPLYALDDFLDGRPVSFIKADIEGYEEDLLCGAEAAIRKYRPHLAICMYHLPTDIFAIPRRIKKLAPEYKMAVRHHASHLAETVLYCWI
jgi:FkbM family methyltransferase